MEAGLTLVSNGGAKPLRGRRIRTLDVSQQEVP
jgi:hypothetical protein